MNKFIRFRIVMMMQRVYAALAGAILIGAGLTGPAHADVYTFTDAQGVIHFTNVPNDPRYSVMIRESYRPPDTYYKGTEQALGAHAQNQYAEEVKKAAREQKLDQALLRAVIAVESGYDPYAVSSKGAVGLMQLMPETAQRYGVNDLYDPAENIHAGARYLRDLMQKFNNDLSLALAAYNAGEDAVIRYGNRIPPYRETRLYVPRVMDLYRRYRPDTR